MGVRRGFEGCIETREEELGRLMILIVVAVSAIAVGHAGVRILL